MGHKLGENAAVAQSNATIYSVFDRWVINRMDTP
jgi:hypothetical protein